MLFSKNSIKLKSKQKTKKIQAEPEIKNKNSNISQLKKDLAAFGIKNYNPKVAPKEKTLTAAITKESPKPISPKTNNKKRSFIKIAGAVGLGLAATSLIPKKAQALKNPQLQMLMPGWQLFHHQPTPIKIHGLLRQQQLLSGNCR